jgi:hypothetical protein
MAKPKSLRERLGNRPVPGNMKRGPKPQRESLEYRPYEQKSPLEIDPQLILDLAHDGYVVEWKAVEVLGQPQKEGSWLSNGWEPCLRSDFGGLLKNIGDQGGPDDSHVQVGGLTLMIRPKQMHDVAKQHQKREAQDNVDQIQGLLNHGIPVRGGSHPTALRSNKINRSYERIEIPSDE